MIFEKIELFNFGIYQGQHSITLDCPDYNQPVILIGALNGAGKTTFLDALQLVLYGKYAKCSNRGKLSYAIYLERCINSYSYEKAAFIKLRFRHGEDKKNPHIYEITRSWNKEENKECKEEVHVSYNGNHDQLLSENWDDFVNEFIPQSISELFFFDGEKIEDLANPKRSAEFLKSGIEALLGLELLSTLAADLNELKKRKQSRLLEKEDSVDLEEIKNKLVSLNSRKSTLFDELKEIDSSESKELELYNISQEKLRASGADKVNSENSLRQEKNIIIQNDNIIKYELLRLASSSLPLNLITEYIIKAEEQANIEQEYNTFTAAKDLLDEQKKLFLKALGEVLDKNSLSKAEEQINKKAQEKSVKRPANIFLDIDPSYFNGIIDRINEDKTNTISWLEKKSQTENSLVLIERKINTLPAPESVAELIAHNIRLEEKLTQIKNKKQYVKNEISLIQKEIDSLDNLQNMILLKTSSIQFEEKRQNQIISQIDTLREIAISFNTQLVLDNISKLERKIKAKFDQLKRKNSLINRVKINPSTYSLVLFSENNQEITTDRLSAGERQLLSISILWGLAESSGKELPTIIDTPMGRLDGEHRNLLINEYFPNAASQVILLSTDEEIYGPYYGKLRPYLAKEYHIIYDENLRSSFIKPGYLEAAL